MGQPWSDGPLVCSSSSLPCASSAVGRWSSGIHQQTVYQWARSGELPAIKVGRVWRFRPSDMAEWQGARVAEAAS